MRAPHDHGNSFGWIVVVSGVATHTLYTLDQRDVPVPYMQRLEQPQAKYFAAKHQIHSMGNLGSDQGLITLHVYAPPISGMKVYDLAACAACVVSDDCGAWWPTDQRQMLEVIKLRSEV